MDVCLLKAKNMLTVLKKTKINSFLYKLISMKTFVCLKLQRKRNNFKKWLRINRFTQQFFHN